MEMDDKAMVVPCFTFNPPAGNWYSKVVLDVPLTIFLPVSIKVRIYHINTFYEIIIRYSYKDKTVHYSRMPDYQRGKIYKITNGDLTYIGSTCEPTLARRLSGHVKAFKLWKDGKTHKITSFQVLELGNYEITLLELCPCGSKDELTARERHWVETIPCVNKSIPGRTRKEWFETHKEQIKEWTKQYREDNKEQIKEQKKKYDEAHKEEIKEQKKNFRETHKEELKEQNKAYYQANKEKICKAKKEKRAEKYLAIIK
jgi:hypothetical protein